MKYSIVIPTYNHLEDCLKPCVETLLRYTKIQDIELIISANGCTDGTSDYVNNLIAKFNYLGLENHIKLAWSDEPLGYAKATNAGIKLATTDYIVLLNNDVVFTEQYKNRWIDLFMKNFNDDPNCGISCVVKGPSDPAGRDFAIFFIVMIHRKVFDKIGLLSLDYGVGGHEDTEFSIETENAGFTVLEAVEKQWRPEYGMHTGDFPVFHKGEATVHDKTLVPEWDSIFLENSLKVSKKYNPTWYRNKMIELGREIPIEEPVPKMEPREEFSWMSNIPEFKKLYEEVLNFNVYRLLPDHIQNRPVIDIGANIGCFTLMALSYGAKNVLSVEPVSKTFDYLRQNIDRAGYKNAKALKFAVTDKNEDYVKIPLQSDNSLNGIFYNETTPNFEIVETITLNKLLSKIDTSSNDVFLKVDCEGAEYDILLNATDDDINKIDTIVLEIHADVNPNYKGFDIIENKLINWGYTKYHEEQIYQMLYNERGEIVQYNPLPVKQVSYSKTYKRLWNT